MERKRNNTDLLHNWESLVMIPRIVSFTHVLQSQGVQHAARKPSVTFLISGGFSKNELPN